MAFKVACRPAAIAALALATGGAARAADFAEPGGTQVQGIIVTARKPAAVRTLIDRTVYDVKTDLQARAGTAADVLNDLPSVEVDADGDVTLRGDPNVTILINGRPSAQFSGANAGLGLQQFPAADIDHIEVMTNPPAQYKVEGSGGVINIITKKTRRQGLTGQAQASLGDKRRFVAAANVSYVAGKLSLSAGVTVRQDYRHRIVADDRTAVDPSSGRRVASHESIDETLQRLTPLISAGADYAIDPSRLFGVSASHQELTGHRYFGQSDASAAVTGAPLSASDRQSDGHEWDKNTSEEAHFEQKLRRPGESLNLSVKRTVNRERERYAYVNTFNLPAAAPSMDDLHLTQNLVTTEASAAYDLPGSHSRDLKLGYDFEDDDNAFNDFGDTIDRATGLPIPNPNVTYEFRYRQQIHAGYVQCQTPLGRWTVQSGVRLEETSIDTSLTAGAAHSQRYFRAYPSLHVERPLSALSTFSFSVARRVNRPNAEALNPFVDHQDIYNLRAGNATLLPEDVWSYEAGYRFDGHGLSAGLTGYYRFSRDAVTDVTQVVSANVVLVTKANLGKSRSGGAEFTAGGRLIRNLSFNVSGNLFYNQIDATPFGGAGLRSTVGFNAKASLDWRATGNDTAQISFSRSDRRLTPQGYIGAINLVNLGYRRQLSPSLTAVVTLSDALGGQTFRRYVVTPTLNDAYSRRQVGGIVYVGLVYAFGGSKKAKPAAFDYDQ
jgi:outer membrane receptor protein involved in Fe transport